MGGPEASWAERPLDVGNEFLNLEICLLTDHQVARCTGNQFCHRILTWERDVRKCNGYLVPYQNIEVERVRPD